MKKTLTILVCLLAAATGFCQVVDDIDTSSDYEARFTRLNRAYAKSPNSVDALYDMAMFYYDNTNPMQNLPMAMKYIQRAEARQIELLENEKLGELTRLARKNITIFTIRQAKQGITDAAYNTLEMRTDMSRVELDTYLDAFGIDIALVRLLRQRRINQVYDEDLRKGTAQSYYHFIDIYPGTNEAEQMEERLSKLAPGLFDGLTTEAAVDSVAAGYELSPSVRRSAEKQKSRLAYAATTRRNTIAAYNDFLHRYPTSDENIQAREQLATLLKMQYSELHTARDYADFIDSNADNELADKALVELRRKVNEEHDIEAARIYIERYHLDPYYNDVYNTYYSWHAAEGNSDPIHRFVKENPDFPFQRAVEADMESAEKIDQVNLMTNYLEGDYDRYAGYVRKMMGKKIALVPLQRMLQVQTSQKNYAAALARVRQFEMVFENTSHDEYAELQKVLAAPGSGRSATLQLAASYNIVNPSVNPNDGNLYFTRVMGSSRRICYAVRKDNKWRPTGDVDFAKTDNDGLTFYGFFADGKKMLLGGEGDIWIAEYDGAQWRITDIPASPVNTDYTETDAYMLPDGSGILLASDRPGGYNLQSSGTYFHGDTALASDLYFIPYTQNGWGQAINLGPDINTAYSERSPILSRNLKTLYFISDGRGGLGYGDVYVATRTNVEDWTSWTVPQNAGKEINSCRSEASISFGPDEKEIYLSSNSDAGNFSCYTFPTWHNATNSYYNYTLEVLGMEDMLLRVRVADMTQQTVTQVIDYVGENHSINLNIHKDKHYAVLGDAGTYFVPAVIIGPENHGRQRLKGYTFSVLVSKDKALPLKAVEFNKTQTTLTPIAELQLEQLAQFIRNNPTAIAEVIIDVAGHDDVLAYNLSLERGRVIRDYLSTLDVDGSQIIISAFGNVGVKNGGSDGVSIRFRERH